MELLRVLHLLAMAFFVGGQLMLAAVVVPVARRGADREAIRAVARRFGVGSLVALAVLAATGSILAGHFHDWGRSQLHWKLALIGTTIVLIALHARRPTWHWLEGLVFLASLAIVWLGVDLAHGGF